MLSCVCWEILCRWLYSSTSFQNMELTPLWIYHYRPKYERFCEEQIIGEWRRIYLTRRNLQWQSKKVKLGHYKYIKVRLYINHRTRFNKPWINTFNFLSKMKIIRSKMLRKNIFRQLFIPIFFIFENGFKKLSLKLTNIKYLLLHIVKYWIFLFNIIQEAWRLTIDKSRTYICKL